MVHNRMQKLLGVWVFLLWTILPAQAQDVVESTVGTGQEVTQDVTALTLDDAVQIALARAYAVRTAQLDLDESRALVSEGWGQLMPQVDLSSSYTRNIRSANPFAGSSAGGLFESLGFLGWLAFNEQARTDTDPTSVPITLADFLDRQIQGQTAAGASLDNSDNPFAVPNQFVSGISVSQKVFDIAAFTGATGASKYLKELSKAGLKRQEQLTVDETNKTFYGALLAIEQANVVEQSVNRTMKTVYEVGIRVAQGTAPKFQRLSAEVELANLETQLIQVRNGAAVALDQLKLVAGIPVAQAIRLVGNLESEQVTDFVSVDVDAAVDRALASRPDVEQARISIELENIQLKVTKGEYYPTLDAFANLNYIGNVPSNRSSTISDPNDPFAFQLQENGFFAGDYWDFSASAGFRLSWNLFNGFQTKHRIRQRRAARQRASILEEQLAESVQLEVQAALRAMNTARLRILSQEKNVTNAELNYSYAESRLREGVASPLDEREAALQRTRIHADHFGRLSARGAVLSTTDEKSTLYRPLPPEALLEGLRREHHQLMHALSSGLDDLFDSKPEDLLWTIGAETAVLAYASKMIDSAHEELMLVLPDFSSVLICW